MNGISLLRLELSPSRGLATAILGVHSAAAGCFLTTMTGSAGWLLALSVIALGAASAWDRALLRGSRSPRAIEVTGPGTAHLVLANGELAAVRPMQGSAVTRYWVALRISSPVRRSVLVTADMLGKERFRLLRLWALWGRVPGVASGQLPA